MTTFEDFLPLARRLIKRETSLPPAEREAEAVSFAHLLADAANERLAEY